MTHVSYIEFMTDRMCPAGVYLQSGHRGNPSILFPTRMVGVSALRKAGRQCPTACPRSALAGPLVWPAVHRAASRPQQCAPTKTSCSSLTILGRAKARSKCSLTRKMWKMQSLVMQLKFRQVLICQNWTKSDLFLFLL